MFRLATRTRVTHAGRSRRARPLRRDEGLHDHDADKKSPHHEAFALRHGRWRFVGHVGCGDLARFVKRTHLNNNSPRSRNEDMV